jgi:hypothetical protein
MNRKLAVALSAARVMPTILRLLPTQLSSREIGRELQLLP